MLRRTRTRIELQNRSTQSPISGPDRVHNQLQKAARTAELLTSGCVVRIVEILDAKGASFVSVTQQFNTTTSMGRLTLNVLLSFAQFEREVIGERIRDKIAASKKKGMWMGGVPPLGLGFA
jgi:DNA invertase Pin-like site-specific DNA recombinase